MRQLQFWTPSEETAKYLRDANGRISEEDKWQEVSEQKIEGFDKELAQEIANRKVDGYRRYRELGQGRHRFKAGWWWVMTVYSDFKTDDFVREYAKYWATNKTVYIEEMASDPRYMGDAEK